MASGGLERRSVSTIFGEFVFHARPEPDGASRPVLLVLTGALMTLKAVNRLPALLDADVQVCLAELPIGSTPFPTVARLTDAVSAATHAAFRGRCVVLLAFGDAALVAARAQAPEILRIIAVEPPVRSDRVWPLRERLRAVVSKEPSERMLLYLAEAYGVRKAKTEVRDHLALFRSPRVPIDLVVGDRPLTPEGPLKSETSHLDEADRAALVADRSVTLRVAPEAGHDLGREAAPFLLETVRQAVTWAGRVRRGPAELGRRLAHAAPRDAQRVLCLSPDPTEFTDAYLALNPQAEVAASPEAFDTWDLLVLVAPDLDNIDLKALLAPVAAGGTVVAVLPLGPDGARLERSLADSGLVLVPPDAGITPLAATLVRARAAQAEPPTRVDIVAFARILMDIRTWLPADALRSDPSFMVNYYTPPPLPPQTKSEPHVLVLQRPAPGPPEQWRDATARAILGRQVVVIEFDDHPELASQMVKGQGVSMESWERFALAHAIQTSTDELAEVFKAYNPEIRVFPNAVFDLAPFRGGPRPPRVFYGGVTRGPFAADVAASLAPVVAAIPDVEFCVVGDRAVFYALPTARKVFHEYAPYPRYLALMAECSVSLSPLETRPMIETKSDAKFLDAARAGVLTIASDIVYSQVIRHGENGLIATTTADWSRLLTQALGDQAGRERMARAAWEEVRDRRMFAHQIPERRAWYEDLLSRREALDQSIMARVPEVAMRVTRRLAALRAAKPARTT